jgi:hypothetical protein
MKAAADRIMLPAPDLVRAEALKKASQLCNAADTYNHLSSSELMLIEVGGISLRRNKTGEVAGD